MPVSSERLRVGFGVSRFKSRGSVGSSGYTDGSC